MEKLFGLPAHPLLVHAPVVLLPLTLLLILAIALRPSWRGKGAWAMVLASIVTLITTFMAKTSGEAFDEALNAQFTIDRSVHNDLAHQTLLLVFVMTLLSVVTAVMDWRYRRAASAYASGQSDDEIGDALGGVAKPSSAMSHVAMLLTLVLAVASTYWMIRTGHEGAKLVHDGKI